VTFFFSCLNKILVLFLGSYIFLRSHSANRRQQIFKYAILYKNKLQITNPNCSLYKRGGWGDSIYTVYSMLSCGSKLDERWIFTACFRVSRALSAAACCSCACCTCVSLFSSFFLSFCTSCFRLTFSSCSRSHSLRHRFASCS
jgi:hypothetical protein